MGHKLVPGTQEQAGVHLAERQMPKRSYFLNQADFVHDKDFADLSLGCLIGYDSGGPLETTGRARWYG
jgi:hypothetical protein